jgi:hypothetical protein
MRVLMALTDYTFSNGMDGLYDFWAEEMCVVKGDERFESYRYDAEPNVHP